MEQNGQMEIDGKNLVQCAVSGKWISPEDAVTFRGLTLSASGKETLFEVIRSGELFAGEIEVPSVSKRISCYFVDGFLLGVVALIVMFGLFDFHETPTTPIQYLVNGFAGILIFVFDFLYFGLMHAQYGKTLGKMAGMIKVVNMDGSPINLRTSFFRTLYMCAPWILPSLGMMAGASGIEISAPVTVILQLITGVYFLIDCILALLDKAMQRSLHDRLAKTRVIVD